MNLELVSSATGPETERCGWQNRIKVNGVSIMQHARGLNIAIINGGTGQLRLPGRVFDTWEVRQPKQTGWRGSFLRVPVFTNPGVADSERLCAEFVTFLNQNSSPGDIIAIVIVDSAPYISSLAASTLLAYGALPNSVKVLVSGHPGSPDHTGWSPWVFATQKNDPNSGRMLIDKIGVYASTVSSSDSTVELSSEKAAREEKERATAVAAQTQQKLKEANAATQKAHEEAREADIRRLAAEKAKAEAEAALKKAKHEAAIQWFDTERKANDAEKKILQESIPSLANAITLLKKFNNGSIPAQELVDLEDECATQRTMIMQL